MILNIPRFGYLFLLRNMLQVCFNLCDVMILSTANRREICYPSQALLKVICLTLELAVNRYVTLVSNQDYVLGAKALARSLQMCWSQWPLTVMAAYPFDELSELEALPPKDRGPMPASVSSIERKLQTALRHATAAHADVLRMEHIGRRAAAAYQKG